MAQLKFTELCWVPSYAQVCPTACTEAALAEPHLHAALGPPEQLGIGCQVAEGHFTRHSDQAGQREVNQCDLHIGDATEQCSHGTAWCQ